MNFNFFLFVYLIYVILHCADSGTSEGIAQDDNPQIEISAEQSVAGEPATADDGGISL